MRPTPRLITELPPPSQLDIEWSPVLTKRDERILKLANMFVTQHPPGHPVGGKDLDPEAERLLSQHYAETEGTDFVFVTKYPRAARPFYAYPEGEGLTRGFDLLFRGIEITSGGQRIHEYPMLQESIAAYRLNPEALAGYAEVFKYGMPPHGGFAIGAERLTARLLGIGNVRFARAFPRDRHRLTP